MTGECARPLRRADSLYIEGGLIREIGSGLARPADLVIDAAGTTAIPGLIDSHSHPTFGDFTPAQNAVGWITHYLHGGVTALVSAGELHLPGLPIPPDARTALALAHLAKRCWVIDGEPRVTGRSQQTPPPERAAVIEAGTA